MNTAALQKELRQSPSQESTPMRTPQKRPKEKYLLLRMHQMISTRQFPLVCRYDTVEHACDNIFRNDPDAIEFLRGEERTLTESEIAVAVRIRDRLLELTEQEGDSLPQ